MRLAYILLGMFLLFAGIRAKARPLTAAESLTLIPLKKTLEVKKYMQDHLDQRRLKFPQLIALRAMELACKPLEATLTKIEGELDTYPDQKGMLFKQYALCSEGALGLSQLYIRTNNKEENEL
jgi:hypothetical protein